MLTVFNRRELTVTFSLEEKSRVEDLLDASGIPYTSRAAGRSGGFGSSRSRMGTMGENLLMESQYFIYVHRDDYDRACACLRG